MEKIYSQIKNETTKYSDVTNVYQKLQDSGSIKAIHDLIQQVFAYEKKYTYDEITKIMQAYPNKKINLENQLRLNGTIFKTNFHLIMDIIIDMIYADTYTTDGNFFLSNNNSMAELAKFEKIGMSQKSLNNSSQKIYSPSNKSPNDNSKNNANAKKNTSTTNKGSTSATINPSNNRVGNMNSQQERKNPRLDTVKSHQGLSTSMVVTRNDAKAFKKKKQIEKGDAHSNNPHQTINNASFLSQKNQRLNQSTNSFYSHSMIYPNLDSEFSYLGGKSTYTFPRTERMKDQPEISPGPIYEVDKSNGIVRKKSPDIKFDKAEKTSWFDEKFKQGSQSPGFIYNPSKHFTSK